jgi:hypothetical protein
MSLGSFISGLSLRSMWVDHNSNRTRWRGISFVKVDTLKRTHSHPDFSTTARKLPASSPSQSLHRLPDCGEKNTRPPSGSSTQPERKERLRPAPRAALLHVTEYFVHGEAHLGLACRRLPVPKTWISDFTITEQTGLSVAIRCA